MLKKGLILYPAMKLFNIILGATLVFFIVMFLRCEKVTEISELIKNTEKIQIVFFNDTGTDTFIDITDKGAIKSFNNYFSNTDVPLYKCNADGEIKCILDPEVTSLKNNTVTMQFFLQEGCLYVTYFYSEALHSKQLTERGVQFLSGLKK